MPGATDGYALRGGQWGYDRLTVLARERWPDTLRLLERAGVRPGLRCLDLGCGGGAVTRELARRVGPDGSVVGIDRDPVQLGLARAAASTEGLANVEFREADATTWSEPSSYDLVYSRFLLQHLASPRDLIREMWRAVRPGGVLVLEDADHDGWSSVPENDGLRLLQRLLVSVLAAHGGDGRFGHRLERCCREAGVPVPERSTFHPCGRAPAAKALAPLTLESIADSALSAGLATRAELARGLADLRRLAADPGATVCGPEIVQVIGRRAGGVP